jgi:hypothetical protein
MTIATNLKLAKTALLCTVLFSANAVWSSCPESGGQANATDPDGAQAKTLSATTHNQSGTMSATELYAFLHDAKMHKPDGMGDYEQNYRTDYPR